MKRQLLSIILSCALCLGLFPQTAFAADGGVGSGGDIYENTTDISQIFGNNNATLDPSTNTITLINNVTVSSSVQFKSGEWTLNLNNYTLRGKNGEVNQDGTHAVRVENGTLTIQGPGTLYGGDGGLCGGSLTSREGWDGSALYVTSDGVVEIGADVTIKNKGSDNANTT